MSRYFKLSLLSIVLLAVCISTNISAAKPDTDQIISYGPIHGKSWICLARNLSEEKLKITWDFDLFDGSSASSHIPRSMDVNAESTVGSQLHIDIADMVDCIVSWKGQKGDVRGTLCAYEEVNLEVIIGCFELN
jgi:hypothetical protein